MAGPRQPTNLILAKGTKHFSQDEIKERLSREVQPCTDHIAAPSFLSTEQAERFNMLANQLQKIKIMGETDVDTLARYVIVQEQYEHAVKDLAAVEAQRPTEDAPDLTNVMSWVYAIEKLDRRLERYFKQANSAAAALGLTISSRCKLVVPSKETEEPKRNKFSQFSVVGGDNK